jgi:hypothetical protein
MSQKTYVIRFYSGMVSSPDSTVSVSTTLKDLCERKSRGEIISGYKADGLEYELRELEAFNCGESFKGVLAVLRDEAPHIRDGFGNERPIELEHDERLIEKNYFLHFKDRELLVWQVNGKGSHVNRLEAYLKNICGCPVVFADIINSASLEKLDRGPIRRIKFKIARQRNAEAIDPNCWESRAFELMGGVDATTLSIEVATRRKKKGLSDSVKEAVHRLMDRTETRSIEVKLLGIEEPIDIFADRIKDRIQVEMRGLYPVPSEMFSELASAKDRQAEALDAYFGVGSNVLV